MNPDLRWEEKIGFYQDLIERDHQYVSYCEPMIGFLGKLEKSPYRTILYPITSHIDLWLSTTNQQDLLWLRPKVCVHFDGEHFDLRLTQGLGSPDQTEIVEDLLQPYTLHRIVDWLGARIPGD